MILDNETRLASAQALSASGATTNYYDQGAQGDLGRGEPMAMVFTVTTAADSTTGDETYQFDVQMDTTSAFGSATSVASKTVAAANLAVGDQVVIPLPPGVSEEFVRGYATLGGTTPSVAFDCDIMPLSMANRDHEVTYPGGFTVS